MTGALQSAQNFLSALPEELPVYPLSGAVLLPRARLPLNITATRDRAMIEDALGKGRLIGMIQPSADEEMEDPPLYSVGCAGRITSFNEIDDGRLLIVLAGICRFKVLSEMPRTRLFRTVKPEWTSYLADLGETEKALVDRDRLIDLMRIYFKKNSISVDWSVVKNAPDDILLPTIVMICPFAAAEKQALLEAESFAERAKMLVALLEIAAMPQRENEAEMRH